LRICAAYLGLQSITGLQLRLLLLEFSGRLHPGGRSRSSFGFVSPILIVVLVSSPYGLFHSDIPSTWPVKTGTNLSQAEVEAFEAAGFKIDDDDEAFEQFI
jgi:hypothetical protein